MSPLHNRQYSNQVSNFPIQKSELSELSEKLPAANKTFSPRSFIKSGAAEALATLPLYAWDVLSAAQFLSALGIADKMLVNRWLYRQVDDAPPFEPVGRWKSGPGAPRVIRKDKAMAWISAPGIVTTQTCWLYAALDLAPMGWPKLDGPKAVQDALTFLFGLGVIQPSMMPAQRTTIDQLYI